MVKHYSKNIQNAILMELFKATNSIKIAVAWFTNDLLFQPLLMKAEMGISVELIVNNDEINISDNNNVKLHSLVDKGGKLRMNNSPQLMHDKFCIIDQKVVICGSYNWTNKAEQNEESISIFTDEQETIDFYIQKFNSLAEKYALVDTNVISSSKKQAEIKGKNSLSWFDKVLLADNIRQKYHAVQIKQSFYFLSDDYSESYPEIGFSEIKPAIQGEHALVKHGDLWGIYNHMIRRIIVPIEYDEIKEREHGVYVVKKNGKQGLIASSGETLLSPSSITLIPLPLEGPKASYYICSNTQYSGLFETVTKQMVLPIQYRIKSTRSGVEIEKNGKIGIFDVIDMRIKIPAEYDEITIVDSLRYYIIKKGEYEGVVSNKDGSVIIPIGHYNEISIPVVNTFRDIWEDYECAIVRDGEKYGLVSLENGTYLIECTCYQIRQIKQKPFVIIIQRVQNKDNKHVLRKALYSLKCKEYIFPFKTSFSPLFGDYEGDYMTVVRHNKYGVFSLKEMKLCVPCEYDSVQMVQNCIVLSRGEDKTVFDFKTNSIKTL